MKTKYILHGGFTRKENEHNSSFFREFVKDIPEKGNILMCFFASGEEDKSYVFSELKDKFLNTAPSKEFAFELAHKDNFLSQLKNAGGIYFHGGKTPVLLNALKDYQDLNSLFNGKVIAGSSAGAYMLSKYGTAHSESHIREGFGFVNVRVVCHHESPELPPTQDSLIEIESISPELELVLLKDCEWRVFLK